VSNDAATLNSKLATALRDTAYAVWNSTELDDLISWAVAGLYPRFVRPLDPTTTTVTLVEGTYFYPLPSGVVEVSTVETYNATTENGPLDGQTWQVVGDAYAGTGKLRVSPVIAQTGDTARLFGYGTYDVTANYIPDILVPLVLARARGEAYRRMAGDRAKFEQWLAVNQTQNVSVNELLQLVNESDADAIQMERRLPRSWRRPVAGRLA
jgi:hypothetical protein